MLNHSGWNVGRLGAQGLYNICTPVSASNAKPGDLVFFEHTYDTDGVSHVGIYVGDGMMIAAGDPISYTSIEISYTAPLTGKGDTEERLAVLWDRFNNDHPADYHRPSLSVSDIVALKQNGVVSCHYVDSFGFQELPVFLKPENYLKSAEMAMEDDYGMLDGIINNGPKATVAELEQQAKNGQPISLLELAEASWREHDEKKKSVVERLRNQPVSREHKKAAPDRGAEMER